MSHKRVTFKEYSPGQGSLLPPYLSDLIPENHLVRVVSRVIDELDMTAIFDTYEGGGTSGYHPRMLLKVLLYGYVRQIYSCRKMAAALDENIHFMWLSGNEHPCFKTINNFRSGRLKITINEVFTELVMFLLTEGMIDKKAFFVDGSKLQARSNKYTPVWRKNTERYKRMVQERIKEINAEIDAINEEENKRFGESHLPEYGEHINSEDLGNSIDELTDRINSTVDKKKKKELAKKRTRLKNEKQKLEKYEEQEALLDGRNSYSKTDPDATFMRMKDERLLPCYNTQISTQNQFVTHYTISQNPSDQVSFAAHFESIPDALRPDAYVGDAGYGTEENYSILEDHGIENYLKYPEYNKEHTRKYQSNQFHKANFHYLEEEDCYICPDGRKLIFHHSQEQALNNGAKTELRIYRCADCSECPFAKECLKGKSNRTITFRPRLEQYKSQARDNLNSEQGEEYRKRRGVEVESVFGQIKHNRSYGRLTFRGLTGVHLEFGLLCFAHNLIKIASCMPVLGHLLLKRFQRTPRLHLATEIEFLGLHRMLKYGKYKSRLIA